jgi:hypothetical protein
MEAEPQTIDQSWICLTPCHCGLSPTLWLLGTFCTRAAEEGENRQGKKSVKVADGYRFSLPRYKALIMMTRASRRSSRNLPVRLRCPFTGEYVVVTIGWEAGIEVKTLSAVAGLTVRQPSSHPVHIAAHHPDAAACMAIGA